MFFQNKISNLGYASQDIKIDSMLFFAYVPKMKALKMVFIELDYHRLEEENKEDYFRLSWYYFYHGINCVDFMDKFSLYGSNVPFFNGILADDFFNKENLKKSNKYGFVVKNYNNKFKEMNYDSLVIEHTAMERLKLRHTEVSSISHKKNKKRILSMVNYCLNNKIEVFLYTTPLYYTYRNQKILMKEQYRNEFIDSLVTHTKINFLDLENASDFNLSDFSDDDHLNPKGAKKLSLKLNKIIQNY